MKKTLLTALCLAVLALGCSKTNKVTLPDHKSTIDSNTARILLLEANDKLQDLEIEELKARMDDAELRLDDAESAIDANEVKIADLCNSVSLLEQGLVDLRNDLNSAVAQLRAADRQTRRELRRKVRRLRRALVSEIRSRRIADYRLQSNIDSVERDLNRFEARQRVVNTILSAGLFLTNIRISQLQSQIQRALRNINNRLNNIEADITSINGEIATMQSQISSLQTQLNEVEGKLVSVVYPCGEGNSEEVLLETQDGLVAYFQQTSTETVSVPVQETIPAYAYCDHPWKWLAICPPGRIVNVPETMNNTGDTVEVSYEVLDKAYLDVLVDGSYSTTDGYSCSFTVSNGEVL